MKNKKIFLLGAIIVIIFSLASCSTVQNTDTEISNTKVETSKTENKVSTTNKTNSSYVSVSTSSTTDKTEDIVYKTKTGSKYHSSGCQYLSKSKISITREKAIKQGLTPCSRYTP